MVVGKKHGGGGEAEGEEATWGKSDNFLRGMEKGRKLDEAPTVLSPLPLSYHFRRTNTFPFQVFVFFFFRTLFFLPSLLGWLGIWQEEVGGEEEEGAYFGGGGEKCPLLLSRVFFSLAGCRRRRLYCHNHQLFCYSFRVRPYVASRQESSTQELALFYRAFIRTCPSHVERVCMAAALPPITQKLWDPGRRKFCLVAWPKSPPPPFIPPSLSPPNSCGGLFPTGPPVGRSVAARRGDTTEGKKTDKLFRRQF